MKNKYISKIITRSFEKFPEIPIKNSLRKFLAFNILVPKSIQNLSPLKGYELHRKLKNGDIVVDAGAFTGDYTVFAAKKVGKEGRVIAFEPDEKNRKILEKNLKYENLNNVTIIPRGLWGKNTTLKFQSSEGLHSTFNSKKAESTIKVVKLDDELKKLRIDKLDVLKMDIEGAEIEAIKGSIVTLKKFHPFVIIASYHEVNGKETSIFLENFLKKIGFKVISDFPNHKTTYAWKTNKG